MTWPGAAKRELEFLEVAHTGDGPYPHPLDVWLHIDGSLSRFYFSLGPHAANEGGQVPLNRVVDARTGLNPAFAKVFDAGDLHWLVPFLVRLDNEEDVTDEIVAAHRKKHGKSPNLRVQDYYDG